ncbi:MAG: DUF3108 domain-containing protein [Deltaproteobacteria bacterium]|nr:DUF3108 domain-containing protein [Deltaproteobacteria bacterium]
MLTPRLLPRLASAVPTLLALVWLVAAPAARAETAAETQVEQSWRYELRALGSRAGEVVMTLGGPRKVGSQSLRSVRIEARTDGMAARLFPAVADGTSWIDRDWLPVRADWTGSIAEDKREIRYKYRGNRTKGEYRKGGQVLLSLDQKLADRTVDTVSVLTWVMSRDMTPGATYSPALLRRPPLLRHGRHGGQGQGDQPPGGLARGLPGLHHHDPREDPVPHGRVGGRS